MGRLWIGRLCVVLTSLAIGYLLLITTTGVREVHQPSVTTSSVLPDPLPSAQDWPWWRGTSGQNSALNSHLPLRWSVSENVAWQRDIPGRGHSSPCVWGSNVFLTTSDTQDQTISLLCLNGDTGQLRWQTVLQRGGVPEIHQKNSHASATPACDGQNIYVAHVELGQLIVSAVNFMGQLHWRCPAGAYASEWGYGSSIAIHKSLVIVCADNRGRQIDRLVGTSWLAGLHRETGKVIWRVKRPDGDSFGSPVVAHVAGRDQLLVAGQDAVSAYDPPTGDLIWKCSWNCKRTANSVAFDDQHVFASTRQPQSELICIRADGAGDVTQSHLMWREKKAASDVASPCVYGDNLYSAADDGVLNCLNKATGKVRWKTRLGGNISSSPLIAGGYLYCCNEDGTTFVLDVTGQGKVVAESMLEEGIFASPIVSNNRIYLRTLGRLYCLVESSNAVIADQQTNSTPRN